MPGPKGGRWGGGRKRKRSDGSTSTNLSTPTNSTPSPTSSTSSGITSAQKAFLIPVRRSERAAAAALAKRRNQFICDDDDPEIGFNNFNNNYKGQIQSPPKKKLRIEIPPASSFNRNEDVILPARLKQQPPCELPAAASEQDAPGTSTSEPPPPPTLEDPVPTTPRRSPNGYLLPDPLPMGLMIKDLRGRTWSLGKSVGLGGFGEIYSAVEVTPNKSSPRSQGQYVVKVEPFNNGPLFVEVNFYLRTCKKDSVVEYKEAKELDHLGVPHIEGSGSFRHRDKRFRFMVIPRFGTDLQTLIDDSKLTLSPEWASQIACQVVDSYQYIHSKGFVHKDVKGSNLLFEYSEPKTPSGGRTSRNSSRASSPEPSTPAGKSGRKIFLVDYGLVSKYTRVGVHKPYVRDERCAHEGTLEYTARDFHLGCVSRRGDLEVLLYCVIDWLGGKLPWDLPTMAKPTVVHEAKIKAFHDPSAFMATAFAHWGERGPPKFLLDLMNYINQLGFEEQPDYDYVRALFKQHSQNTHSRKRPSVPDVSLDTSADSSADEVTLSMTMSCQPPSASATPSPSPAPPAEQQPPTKRKNPASPKKRVLRRRKSGDDADSETSNKQQSPKSCTSSSHLSEYENESESEEDIERVLSNLSARRYEEECDAVTRASDAECLLNPTPLMLTQMAKIRQRAIDRSMGLPPPISPFRKRNRSLSGCRTSFANRRKSMSKTPSPPPPSNKMNSKSAEKKSPVKSAISRCKLPRSAKSEVSLTTTHSQLFKGKNKKQSIENSLLLRRSARSHLGVLNSKKSPDKKTSISQNIYNWFVNGTKSILRISQN